MENRNEKILIVEDDPQIRSFIGYSLKREGFPYMATGTAQGALSILVSEQIDLMLLDLGLPDFDGMEGIRKIREWAEMPIIVVSARDQDKEKAAALDKGADDYLTKPVSATELLARIRVGLRHLTRSENARRQAALAVGDLRIDFDKGLVYLYDAELHVTPMEYSLLSLFFITSARCSQRSILSKKFMGSAMGPIRRRFGH
jgi:two-component system KDP operon response regulator KdpE